MLDEKIELKESLLFLHVAELREIAKSLSLEHRGVKKILIFRICHFLETGERLKDAPFPKESCSKRGASYPLEESTLMLRGAYKNDLKNRLFFKKLIGDHFHFTAFGIDWLNERWLSGKPPTYLEFTDMWSAEYAKRKILPVSPKEEWAYINFVQTLLKENPSLTKESLLELWNKERERQKKKVLSFLSTRQRE